MELSLVCDHVRKELTILVQVMKTHVNSIYGQ